MTKPPFTVSSKAISMIAEISALVERFAIRFERDALKLRRANKIKTIYSSLAIEGNTLSETQVGDILNGKNVVAPIRELQEVKNAIAVYDNFASFNPFSLEDLLRAHAQMMSALVETAGQFRRSGVGVFDGDRAVHIAPPFERVPELMANLFDWLKNAYPASPKLSRSFDEFEFIHPFADGNGRMGRLWQSLILSKLNPVFQYLPVETLVHDNQLKYYEAINASTANNDSGAFIDFMLGELLNALKIHQGEPIGRVNGGVSGRVNEVFGYIKAHEGCNAGELSAALSIPKRTLARDLKKLADQVEFRGAPKTGGYYLK